MAVERDRASHRPRETGLSAWMWAVLTERVRVLTDPAPDAVHDLRVSIRRCRSVAEGFIDLDPSKEWRRMRRAGKGLFEPLGALRDTHVLQAWLERLADPSDPVRVALSPILAARAEEQTATARAALEAFDVKRWETWARTLPERADRVPLESPVFEHLALQRWRDAVALHEAAEKEPAGEALHRLRIAVKRFRYTVENFLPARYARWKKTLKKFQDLLGEVHDLDELEAILPMASEAFDAAAAERWRAWLEEERRKRTAEYLRRAAGDRGAWRTWREELPPRARLARAALERLVVWGAYHDANAEETRRVADRAEALYEVLRAQGWTPPRPAAKARRLLRAAAGMRAVGGSGGGKRAYRRIAALDPPEGWTSDDLAEAGLVVRYLYDRPRPSHKALASRSDESRQTVLFLAGLIRTAEADVGPAESGRGPSRPE